MESKTAKITVYLVKEHYFKTELKNLKWILRVFKLNGTIAIHFESGEVFKTKVDDW